MDYYHRTPNRQSYFNSFDKFELVSPNFLLLSAYAMMFSVFIMRGGFYDAKPEGRIALNDIDLPRKKGSLDGIPLANSSAAFVFPPVFPSSARLKLLSLKYF